MALTCMYTYGNNMQRTHLGPGEESTNVNWSMRRRRRRKRRRRRRKARNKWPGSSIQSNRHPLIPVAQLWYSVCMSVCLEEIIYAKLLCTYTSLVCVCLCVCVCVWWTEWWGIVRIWATAATQHHREQGTHSRSLPGGDIQELDAATKKESA